MAKVCEICGRGPAKGASRSHSNIQTKKWRHINLQSKNINGKKVRICSSCLKTKYKIKT
ncbi:50S ribosomal protein L28 [Candidatus Falkowbacteria bacterium]|nr:50S ribosomal protein L28 [Candidatus Falkowbacteria bacterium]